MEKTDVAVIGATGIVGQRLVKLLECHPYFRISALCAGASAGKTFGEAITNSRVFSEPFPKEIEEMILLSASPSLLSEKCTMAFCAVKLPEEETKSLEEALAKREIFVLSLNSACRMQRDVPMIIPEVNLHHLDVLTAQRKRLHTSFGAIVTKCNCALLSFVPLITPLLSKNPQKICVTTLQALSGAGKTLFLKTMQNNILPFIAGEEKKCEQEPKKIWGSVEGGRIENYPLPLSIRAQCFRVPIQDGHFASTVVSFPAPVSKEEVLSAWEEFNFASALDLPSAPKKFINYFEEDERPQPLFDLYAERGMAVEAGRLRVKGSDVSFVGLSHNALRGAAGGAVLLAEALKKGGYLN